MRVMHVITSFGGFGIGGAETMLLKLVRAQAGRGLDFHAVSLTIGGPIEDGLLEAGAGTSRLGMTRGVPNPAALWRLRQIVQRERPDLIQTWMYHSDLIGGLVGRAAGVPVVWGIRNSVLDDASTPRNTRLARRLCAGLSGLLPRAIVSCSQVAADQHVALGYRRDRMSVIPNGFELGRFRPDPAAREGVRAELGVAEGRPLIGIMARFDPAKDHATFVAAAAILARTRPDAAFMACGDGISSDNRVLVGWLEQARLGDRVHLLGRRADVPRLAAALDLATLSSASEGFPNVIGEAMACGVPAAVTDVGDSRWLVGDTGRTVPPRNPVALAAAWAELLALGPADLRALGERARQRVKAEFDIGRTALRFDALYRELLPGRLAAGSP
jgi:glycosyltransferase involved in cell wall biosynthesis